MNSVSINWADYVKICIGMMNMRPSDFWNLSPREMYLSISGFKTFHASGEEKEEPMICYMDKIIETLEGCDYTSKTKTKKRRGKFDTA